MLIHGLIRRLPSAEFYSGDLRTRLRGGAGRIDEVWGGSLGFSFQRRLVIFRNANLTKLLIRKEVARDKWKYGNVNELSL